MAHSIVISCNEFLKVSSKGQPHIPLEVHRKCATMEDSVARGVVRRGVTG